MITFLSTCKKVQKSTFTVCHLFKLEYNWSYHILLGSMIPLQGQTGYKIVKYKKITYLYSISILAIFQDFKWSLDPGILPSHVLPIKKSGWTKNKEENQMGIVSEKPSTNASFHRLSSFQIFPLDVLFWYSMFQAQSLCVSLFSVLHISSLSKILSMHKHLSYKSLFSSLPLPTQSLWVEVLHLNGGGGHGEAEVLVGSQVSHTDWFVLDVPCCYCLILVQVKRAGHRLCLAVATLVLVLVLLLPPCCCCSSSSCPRPGSPIVCAFTLALSPTVGLVLGLVLVLQGLLCCCHSCCSQLVRVVFLHVFDQVSLRGVCAVAEATGVQLGMFHCVCGQVDLQAGGICVASVTVGTLVGLVFVVLPPVRL